MIDMHSFMFLGITLTCNCVCVLVDKCVGALSWVSLFTFDVVLLIRIPDPVDVVF